jgi:SAM-dependent methyltransferase
MSALIDQQRWEQAQASEADYWRGIDVSELLRIAAEKPAFLSMLPAKIKQSLFHGKDVLEIGVGPLGISLASFYPNKSELNRLVKVEPLPQVFLSDCQNISDQWASLFLQWLSEMSQEGQYECIPGENMDYRDEFDTVIIYNVLDHVNNPAKIIENAFNSLKSGGKILIGVDCYSVLGQIKFEKILRRTQKGSIMVEAHPYTFLPQNIITMLKEARFSEVRIYGIPGKLRGFAGRGFRPAFLAVKP